MIHSVSHSLTYRTDHDRFQMFLFRSSFPLRSSVHVISVSSLVKNVRTHGGTAIEVFIFISIQSNFHANSCDSSNEWEKERGRETAKEVRLIHFDPFRVNIDITSDTSRYSKKTTNDNRRSNMEEEESRNELLQWKRKEKKKTRRRQTLWVLCTAEFWVWIEQTLIVAHTTEHLSKSPNTHQTHHIVQKKEEERKKNVTAIHRP